MAQTAKSNNSNNKKKQTNKNEETDELIAVADSRSRTLVAPAGWAFAIWGPIFLGELVFVASQVLLPASAAVTATVQRASGGFLMSQIMQTLWTTAFRPKYKGKYVYVSGALLSGIAFSLSRAHAAFTSDAAAASYNSKDYWLYFLPMTVHFGWTTAASLVNWNGSLASDKRVGAKMLAAVGHVSVVLATVLGVGVTLTRKAPVFGLVIAWALSACASGMTKRLDPSTTSNTNNFGYFNNPNSDDENQAGIYGARTQKWLCMAGACLSAAASPIALWTMRSSPISKM